MSHDVMVEEYPDQEQRAAVCGNIWERNMNMERLFRNRTARIQQDRIRRATFQGAEHLVVPTIAVQEQVLNGELLPAEAIQRSTPFWEGTPITAPSHPHQNGQFQMANSREMLEQFGVGRNFNVRFHKRQMHVEQWYHIARTEQIASGLIQAFENGEVEDVSTAYWAEIRPESGTFNGEEYEGRQENLRPDHIATLLDEPGACSVEDGCGANRTNRTMVALTDVHPITPPETNSQESNEGDPMSVLEQIANLFGLSSGEPAVRLTPIENTDEFIGVVNRNQRQHRGESMDREAIIERLTNNEAVQLTEDQLQEMSDEALQNLCETVQNQAEPETDPETAAFVTELQEAGIDVDAIKTIHDHVQQERQEADAEAETIRTELAENTAFTEDELDGKPLTELRKLQSELLESSATVNFSGQGGADTDEADAEYEVPSIGERYENFDQAGQE